MMGGNLTRMDDWTRGLLTNPEVLAVDQQATDARQVLEADGFSVWRSRPDSGDGEYLAIFNLNATARTLDLPWGEVGLTAAGYRLRDLWKALDLGTAARLRVELPGHGAALYRAFVQ
jgi:hypothetical protein